MTDDELMAGVAAGEEEALRVLVVRWERPLFAFLERMVGSREDAQDLTQETFVRVYQHAGRYRASGRFRSWLFRIAGNLARSRLRRRRLLRWVSFERREHDRQADGDSPVDRIEREQTRTAVRGAIARLPERQRQAVILRQYEGMGYREIASVMGTTVPAVETLLHRAMVRLRGALAGKAVVE